jgi:DNA-binding NarL/FixJ family response regulator
VLQTAGLHALATGSYELAEAFLDDATEIAERYHSAQETGFHARLQAELARRQGRLDDAVRLIDGALELQLAGDNLTYTRESIVEKLRIVRACTAAGHPDAERLVAEAAALVEAFDGTGLANRAMRALMDLELAAITGRADPSAAEATIALLDESGYLHESAQARLLQIDHLVATDPTQRSTLQAQVADLHQLASTHGMAGITDQLAAVAERAGIALAPGEERPTPVGRAELPHHLTAREVEVMSLLAEGLTNKEIAERLYVSPRTVGTHVSNLLAKVGVTTRGAAAAVYHRLGLAELIDLRDTADTSATASTN